MKIAYITVQAPYSKGETFIIPEIIEVIKQGYDVLILPFRPGKKIFNGDAIALTAYTHRKGIASLHVISVFILEILKRPLTALKAISKIISNSRNYNITIKNICAIPKGFYAARIFKRESIDHIHAHWASTPASVAYLASYLSGIPWSFTAHRWDIAENNMLKEKVRTAMFVRAIGAQGAGEIAAIVGDDELEEKISVIHMGVPILDINASRRSSKGAFKIICPANLLPVKGHKYLIEACRVLKDKGLNVECMLAGDGPLENELKQLVGSLKLETMVEFLGRIPHNRLCNMYAEGAVDLVVLPSVTTSDGQKEGIPVALMEAMSYGIPVVSTDTGGVDELVRDSGILVPQKNAAALADAIERIIHDRILYEAYRDKAAKKIDIYFNLHRNTEMLLSRMRGSN